MLLRLLHRTTFVYAGEVRDSYNEVRLRPADDHTQACRDFTLHLEPGAETSEYTDFYGNVIIHFDIPSKHRKLVIESRADVVTVPNGSRAAIPEVPFPDLVRSEEREMVAEFLTDSQYVPLEVELWREAQDALADGRGDVWGDVNRIGRHVFGALAYKPNVTGVHTHAGDALKLRAGVCQDFAHVMIGMCRNADIPARYVSGYFLNAHRRPGEVEASHAWMEAFVPGYGWAAYDPTHDRPADDRYVKLAVGRDYADIRPVSGTYRGAPAKELKVEVTVNRDASDPL
jgi:transglutaminase-like putative cysteine protease